MLYAVTIATYFTDMIIYTLVWDRSYLCCVAMMPNPCQRSVRSSGICVGNNFKLLPKLDCLLRF